MIFVMVELTKSAIDHGEITQRVRSNTAGAVVTFLGTVREFTGEKRTTSLEYEAYLEMAELKMREIEAEARERWPIIQAVLVHRIGHLELGEISVGVAVSCPHRAQAFEACRYMIDRIKEVVPIWKCENWATGESEWVHPGLSLDSARTSLDKT
jgi:molybdopterin synthase catalytic subunit